SPWVSYALRTAWISSSSRPASTSRTSEPLKITMSPSCMARAPVVPARDVRCRHHAWLAFRLSVPEVCDIAKVLRDPFVGIDCIEVAFSAVVKNGHARFSPVYALLHLFYGHEHFSPEPSAK